MTIHITVSNNGPFIITTDATQPLQVINALGETVTPEPAGAPVALCRCGHSANKPFCDGTHSTIGFTDRE